MLYDGSMGEKLPRIFLFSAVALILLTLMSVLVWKFWLKDALELRNYRNFLEAEVVSWNPDASALRFSYSKDSVFKKGEVEVRIPGMFLLVFYGDAEGNTFGKVIESKEDEFWQTAFCTGDKIQLRSHTHNLRKAENIESSYVSSIRNLGPRECQE